MQSSMSNSREFITNTIVWLFIILWMYAAASKLLDRSTFEVQVSQSPLLTPVAGIVSWFMPSGEIILSLFLLKEQTRLIGLYGSFTLITLFSAYIFMVTRYSSYVPCSCGGILQKMTWNQHLLFNVCFMLLSLIGIILHSKNISLQQIRNHRTPV